LKWETGTIAAMSNGQHDDRLELDELDERLTAVERALTDGDGEPAAFGDADRTALADLRERLDDLEAQVADLDAATQALRGYVGNVRSVDRDIERRADAALAKVESLEAELDGETGGNSDERPRGTTAESAVHDSAEASHSTDPHRDGSRADVDGDRTPDTVTSQPDRCERCGAARDDGASEPRNPHGGRSRCDGSQAGAETEVNDLNRGARAATGREHHRRDRPTAGGGRSEWGERAETASGGRRSRDGGPTPESETDEDRGLFASLRESL
jgi:hypothetical protein